MSKLGMGIRVDPEMKDRLHALAEATERPVAYWVNKCLKVCLPIFEKMELENQKSEIPRATQEAILRINQGLDSVLKRPSRPKRTS
jgi:predicted transcriptional regulator